MLNIYVLQLEKGKYYIGKTNNINARLNNHFLNGGSEWTKLYKPTKLIEQIENCDDYESVCIVLNCERGCDSLSHP